MTYSFLFSRSRVTASKRNAMRCDAMGCDGMRWDAMECDANAMRCDGMRCDAMRCDAMRCWCLCVDAACMHALAVSRAVCRLAHQEDRSTSLSITLSQGRLRSHRVLDPPEDGRQLDWDHRLHTVSF